MRGWGDMKGLKTVGASGRWKRWGNGFSPEPPEELALPTPGIQQ